MSSKNDREWSVFSIYLALPLEHCLSSVAASLREAAYISVCRKNVGTNVFFEDISPSSLCVYPLFSYYLSPLPPNYLANKNFTLPQLSHRKIYAITISHKKQFSTIQKAPIITMRAFPYLSISTELSTSYCTALNASSKS